MNERDQKTCDDMQNRALDAVSQWDGQSDEDLAAILGEATGSPFWGELVRLRRIEEAARRYRFSGDENSEPFLRSRGWREDEVQEKYLLPKWYPPAGYPAADESKTLFVALAIELEVSLGLHK